MGLLKVLRGGWRSAAAGLMALALPLAAPGIASARPAPDSFAELAEHLLPTVVNIATTETLKPDAQPGNQGFQDIPPDSDLQSLLQGLLNKQPTGPRRVTFLGSGFVVDPSGLIVTNNHVIDQADQITVTLNDGSTLAAKVVGRDPKTDLALLRVKPIKPLPSAHFGDSDRARVGDWVVAIGNPFGLGSTVTAGIVSARNRDIAAGPYDNFIQTDAPINRGNSGGPLFDMDGNVVGINSVIISPSGGSVGVAFAIPSNMARKVIDEIGKHGVIKRGWMGVLVQSVTDDIAAGMNLPNSTGALVAQVTPGGPAQKAGLQVGDVIVGFDGKPVADSRILPRVVADTPIGKSASVDYLRNGRKLSTHIIVAVLDDTDKDEPAEKAAPPAPAKRGSDRLGLSLGPIDGAARSKYKLGPDVQGVLITGVDAASEAGEKNLMPGDVILRLQNQPVTSPEEVSRRVDADAKAGQKVELLLVDRDGVPTYVAIRLDGEG
jgi:serine protease Do